MNRCDFLKLVLAVPFAAIPPNKENVTIEDEPQKIYKAKDVYVYGYIEGKQIYVNSGDRFDIKEDVRYYSDDPTPHKID